MTTKIMKTTWRLLQERLNLVLDGKVPTRTEKREFYYTCRKAFQDEWDLIEVDFKGAADGSKNPYIPWGDAINRWAIKHSGVLDVEEGRFWRVMSKLNIWPHERGTCITADGREIVVKHSTKKTIRADCSFILVSEKQSKTMDIWKALSDEGYQFNLISMGGHSTGTVQSIAAEVGDVLQMLDAPNFYILSLHDYDIDGITMVQTLRKWYDNVLDVGINKELLEHSEIDKDKKLYEAVNIKKYPTNLMKWVENQTEYSVEELEELLGLKTGTGKKWSSKGKRIELDTIYGVYGIDPIVKYIIHVLENDTEVWDLTNIGVEEQELDEPRNWYEDALTSRETEVRKKYDEKTVALSEQYNVVLDIVKKTMTLGHEFSDLRRKNWVIDDKYVMKLRELKGDALAALQMEFLSNIKQEWKGDYQNTLDDEINYYLTCWEGSVATAKQDIEERVSELQHNLDIAKKEDKWLVTFRKKLDEMDFGEDEVDEIDVPDPVEEVREVIKALIMHELELKGEIET